MIKKLAVTLALAISLVTSCAVVSDVQAATISRTVNDPAGPLSIVEPRWTYIGSIITGLDIDGLGRAASSTSLGTTSSSYLCKIHAELLQRMPGYYKVVDSWDVSDYGSVLLSKFTYVFSGYTYVLESDCSVWNKSGTTKLESQKVTYEQVYK